MAKFTTILGVRFYAGELPGLMEMFHGGGLVVVPSAPVLAEMPANAAHRQALQGADFAIADSGLMVLIWRLLGRGRLPRISGLRLLRALVEQPEFRNPGATFWIMPSEVDAAANRAWLDRHGLRVDAGSCYTAPIYPRGALEDTAALHLIEARKPKFVVICLGGGVQERLGHYLRDHLSYRPAILCTGAAIAFLSGRQASIPPWADRLYLGWLLRFLSAPRVYGPRYWRALRVIPLLIKNPSS